MQYALWGYEDEFGSFTTSVQRFSSSNAAMFADFDNDGWIDLFVTNKTDFESDRDMLYLNLGEDSEGNWLGMQTVTYTMSPTFRHQSSGDMGIVVCDLEHDGDMDFYITDWYPLEAPNDIWVNQLAETGQLGFVHSDAAPAKFSWGTQWEDFDTTTVGRTFMSPVPTRSRVCRFAITCTSMMAAS